MHGPMNVKYVFRLQNVRTPIDKQTVIRNGMPGDKGQHSTFEGTKGGAACNRQFAKI
jgi:hypothetical protein